VKELFRLNIGSCLQTKVIILAELSPMEEAGLNRWTKSMMQMISDAIAVVRIV